MERSNYGKTIMMVRCLGFIYAIAVLVFAGITGIAAAGELTVRQLTARLFVVEDSYYIKENSIFYAGDDHLTVIGATWTPDTARLLAEKIRRITNKPITEVINTNYHPDRAGGNAYWQSAGAHIIATAQTSDMMKAHWKEVVEWTRHAVPEYPQLPLILPTDTFAGDFALQNERVKALYLGPSHTQDGIFVYFPEEKVLYGGCILKEQLGNLDFADLAGYPNTLRKLEEMKLPIEMIVAGHYSPIHGPELISQYFALLEAKRPR